MEVNVFNYVSAVKAVREGLEGLAALVSSNGGENAVDTSAALYRMRDEFDRAMDAVTVHTAPAEKETVDDDGDEFVYGDRYMYLVQDLEAQGMGEEAAAALAYRIIDEERTVDEW